MSNISEKDPYYAEMKELKELENRRTLIADGDYELPPTRCPCGGRIIEETSQIEADVGRKYLTCNVFENDGLHIRKIWVHAIQEEVTKLKNEVSEQSKQIRSHGFYEYQINEMRTQLANNADEIARLKELVASIKR
ncbi:hypothetical protein V5N11_019607 [Cardamine amara subsp. amara]|uniref:Uncharacterized protein n=1 Tax=Cardamine amara subsp. amara TaxID=228776 RepID=A0ABD1C902_CARAN